jgi:hypothetical protein
MRQCACRTNPVTKLPQISEERILGIARHLSEDIGFRTVGTYEHALADDWMMEAVEQVKRNCETIAESEGRKIECEVWRQEGSGNHRCVGFAYSVTVIGANSCKSICGDEWQLSL